VTAKPPTGCDVPWYVSCPSKGPAAAAALLDIGTRTIRSFVGSELFNLPAALDHYDLIAALWVRETLYALDIRDHDKWQLTGPKTSPEDAAAQPHWKEN
jgi:hypothetical protein